MQQLALVSADQMSDSVMLLNHAKEVQMGRLTCIATVLCVYKAQQALFLAAAIDNGKPRYLQNRWCEELYRNTLTSHVLLLSMANGLLVIRSYKIAGLTPVAKQASRISCGCGL